MPPEDVRKEINNQGGSASVWNYVRNRYPLAAEYIRWGEGQGYQNRRTCASRTWWWDLGAQDLPPIVLNKGVNDRHFVTVNSQAFCDQQIYEVGVDPHIAQPLTGFLNWTGTAMFWEQYGRRNFGEGVLWIAVYEANNIFVPKPVVLTNQGRKRLLSAFERLAQRPLRSIFEELGFELCHKRRCNHPEHPYEYVKPEELTLEQVKQASPDRFELDSVVFDVLGLTDEERLEVYRAVAQLVKDRLVKARSV
ncbi:hypothetical protein DRJ19_03020 [Candidatus Woesearchaeota archaeon]|nr:MAG: hypothetical protein DRJ19_03020 [Candidatus Woesearchaeota archaeon]